MSAILSLLVSLALGLPPAASNPWKKVKKPARGKPEAIGSYKAGCLRAGKKLPEDGAGYQVMRPSRNRVYGHPDMIAFLTGLAKRAKAKGLGPILIGDISQPRGGPTMSGHASHQNGLDVDIWYWQPSKGRTLSWDEREGLSAPKVVDGVFDRLNKKVWKPKMLDVLRLAAEAPQSERILVDPVVKREACRRFAGKDWVAKLRPWWGHSNHFHLRIRCPAGNDACVSQDAVAPGDGCDATLAEWFTPASKKQAKALDEHPAPPSMPVLPEACQTVLKD